MGTREINIIGYGEPFLHPRFRELLARAKKGASVVKVVTNGTRIEKAVIPTLIDSGLDSLQISLWAHSAETYIRGHPGTNPDMFQKIVEGIERLVEEKKKRNTEHPRLIMHFPINKSNFDTIEGTSDFVKRLGLDALSFSPFRNWGGNLSSLALSHSEERQTVQSLKRVKRDLRGLSISHNVDQTLRRYEIGEAVLDRFPCYVGWVHMRIRTDGTVFPCALYPIGNLNEEPLEEIWNGARMKRFRKITLTRTHLAEILSEGKCGYCGHVTGNEKIDRVFRWFKPFIAAG
jgi:radical SAM protein with 4Fe4S-binding SPASM domain